MTWRPLAPRRPGGLLQSLEFALALHDVLIVPLDVDRLLEPPLEILGRDLIVRGVPGFCSLETAFRIKTRLVEGLAAPEQEADAVFELAVANNRVSVQEPHGVPVPDLVGGVRQVSIDGLSEGVADALVASRLRRVVGLNVLVDRHVITHALGSLSQRRRRLHFPREPNFIESLLELLRLEAPLHIGVCSID
jgi:hypothetical protein